MISRIVFFAVVAVVFAAAHAQYNSNPRQLDLSGGRNFQLDTTGNSRQYIGPGISNAYGSGNRGNPYGSGNRGYPSGSASIVQINSRPGTVQTSYIGERPGGGPVVQVDGVDYTGKNVNRPGLQINQRPGARQYASPGYAYEY